MDRPNIRQSQVVFGDIIYWLTIAAAIICIIGPLRAFAAIDSNILNPHYLFANIWSGMEPAEIWQAAGDIELSGFYWIHKLAAGDGLTDLGVFIGCAVALPAMLVAAIIYTFKEKALGWALGAFWVAGLVAISILGIISF